MQACTKSSLPNVRLHLTRRSLGRQEKERFTLGFLLGGEDSLGTLIEGEIGELREGERVEVKEMEVRDSRGEWTTFKPHLTLERVNV